MKRSPASAVKTRVGDRRGGAHGLELGGLLDRAQPLDEAGARNGLDAAFAQRLVACDGEDVRLDADGLPGEARGEVAEDRARGLLEAHAVERTCFLGVAEVRVQRRLAVRSDEHGRVGAREPGQVADVDDARDEQRLVEEGGEPLDAGGTAHRLTILLRRGLRSGRERKRPVLVRLAVDREPELEPLARR